MNIPGELSAKLEDISVLAAKSGKPQEAPTVSEKKESDLIAPGVRQSDLLPPEAKPQVQPTPEQGPTAQELKASIDALKTQVEARDRELDNLRNENAFYRQLGQQTQPPLVQPQGTPPPASTFQLPTFDYTKPEESVQAIAQAFYEKQETEKRIAESQRLATETQQARERYVQAAKVKYDQGKEAAFKGNPELYKGIEQKLEEGITQAFFSGNLTDEDLRNPATWERGARWLWLEKGEYNKLMKSPTRPVAPVSGEIPGIGRGTEEGEEVEFMADDKTQEMMRQFGLNESQAREIIKQQRIREREGR